MKLIFIDVDGTLLSHKGQVPESAKAALLQAKAKGHKLFLSTGRALSELNETILCVDFDGMIVCGGNTVVLDGEIIHDQNLNQSQLSEMYAYFDEKEIAFYAESNSGLYASRHLKAFLEGLILAAKADPNRLEDVKALLRLSGTITFDSDLMRDDINKITFVGSNHAFEDTARHFGDRYSLFENLHTIYGKNSGEITIKGSDKAVGIQLILDRLGIDRKHTVGIGDANNDLEMLKFVELSIAMGNGTDAVKAVADFITKPIHEDGFAYAFSQLNLI